MKVKIDGIKCTGYGVCEEICPTMFLMDDLGLPEVLHDGIVPAEAQASARDAIEQCPENAIEELS